MRGLTSTAQFTHPEIGLYIKCDVHNWMNAYIHIFDHPFYAVTGKDGSFEIPNLPPGEYELTVWHELQAFKADRQMISVTIEAGKTAKVQFTYRPKPKDKSKTPSR